MNVIASSHMSFAIFDVLVKNSVINWIIMARMATLAVMDVMVGMASIL